MKISKVFMLMRYHKEKGIHEPMAAYKSRQLVEKSVQMLNDLEHISGMHYSYKEVEVR